MATTGGPLAALDVRITDLRIRAESLPNLEAVAAKQEAMMPPDLGKAPRSGYLRIWLAAGLGVILLLGLALAIWQGRRGRNTSE